MKLDPRVYSADGRPLAYQPWRLVRPPMAGSEIGRAARRIARRLACRIGEGKLGPASLAYRAAVVLARAAFDEAYSALDGRDLLAARAERHAAWMRTCEAGRPPYLAHYPELASCMGPSHGALP